MATPTADELLSPEKAALLSGSFDTYSAYFNNLTTQHFRGLNLVMIDTKDPQREQRLREGVMEVFQRPETQNRLGSLSYTEALPLFEDYAAALIRDSQINAQRAQARQRSGQPQVTVAGHYSPNFPAAEIVRMGGKISPITVDNGQCTSCNAESNLRATGDDPHIMSAMQQFGRIAAGFHELGHAISLQDNNLPSAMFAMVTGANQTNAQREESIADSFRTLMIAREFGDLGNDYLNISQRTANVDGIHYTERSIESTRIWIYSNPDQLKTMSPAELFRVAKRIGTETALSSQELAQAQSYFEHYNNPADLTNDAVSKRLAAAELHRQGRGPAMSGYSAIAEEMDNRLDLYRRGLPEYVAAMGAKLEIIGQAGVVDTSSLRVPLASPASSSQLPTQPANKPTVSSPGATGL